MRPGVRKAALAAHLTCSIGWIGAIVAYLPFDLTVTTSHDVADVRAAWTAMALIVSVVIVPLAIASLATGLVMAVGTRWGLLRHWWVVISLALTVFATLVLVVEAGVIAGSASIANDPATSDAALLAVPGTLPHSVGGLVVLLLVQVLNVYKPKGMTRYGWRRQQEERRAARPGHDARPVPEDESRGLRPG